MKCVLVFMHQPSSLQKSLQTLAVGLTLSFCCCCCTLLKRSGTLQNAELYSVLYSAGSDFWVCFWLSKCEQFYQIMFMEQTGRYTKST